MADVSSEDHVKEFRANRRMYELFAEQLEQLVRLLLRDARLEVIQITSRTKTVESFAEKIGRKGKSYSNPLVDVTDLVGLRIIAYYLEDLKAIGDLLADEFLIDRGESEDKATTLGLNEFGYMSTHYIVSLNDARAKLPEWKGYASLKAEIQVRTSLQHAWAAVSHKLSYKKVVKDFLPPILERRLNRLSALLELADEEFSALRREQRALAEQHAEEVGAGNLSARLDTESVDAYISSKEGEIPLGELHDWYDPDDVPIFSDRAESRQDLLDLLRENKVATIKDLDRIIGDDRDKNREDLAALAESLSESSIMATSVYDVLHALVLLRTDAELQRERFPYSNEYWDAIEGTRLERGYR